MASDRQGDKVGTDKVKVQRLRVVEPSPHHDNSAIHLSSSTWQSLGLRPSHAVLVKGNRGTSTPLRPVQNHQLASDTAVVNDGVRWNLRLSLGDTISVSIFHDIPRTKRAAIAPLLDTIDGWNGSIFKDCLAPYFRQYNRPVKHGELFKVDCGTRTIEFRIIELDPAEYGVIVQDTVIHCELQPVERPPYHLHNGPFGEDVGGNKWELAELRKFVEVPLFFSHLFTSTALRPSRGILISGPTGVGKTYMIKAIANELQVVYICSNTSEIASVMDVDKLFTMAYKYQPCIVCIDDIDSIDHTQRGVTQRLISSIDGLKTVDRIAVLATTRNSHVVNTSLRRHGLFSDELEIKVPKQNDRCDILRVCTRDMKLSGEVSLPAVATAAEGFVAADLAALCSKAYQQMVNRNAHASDFNTINSPVAKVLTSSEVDMPDFQAALNTMLVNRSRQPVAMETFTYSNHHGSSVKDVARYDYIGSQPNGGSRSPNDYTIACICPMGVELAAVEGMLDEIHEPLPIGRDHNIYTLGRIGHHLLVVAVMSEIGGNAATGVAIQMLNDFPSIRFSLLVGIGGGVPGEFDVRLGDVVVSQPTDTFGGVVQYDLGKWIASKQFQRKGMLNKPPHVLSGSVRKLEAHHLRVGSKIGEYISEMLQRYPKMVNKFSCPSVETDLLFKSSYSHQLSMALSCNGCSRSQTETREPRHNNEPQVHYGTIGSANVVVKDPLIRDALQQDMNILCVEMEAAGLVQSFPCLVIRGISDYADSHKNDKWQPYAAAVAAAYMKELLSVIHAKQVAETQTAVARTTIS